MIKLLQINKSKPLKGRENNCVGKQKLTRHSQSLAYFLMLFLVGCLLKVFSYDEQTWRPKKLHFPLFSFKIFFFLGRNFCIAPHNLNTRNRLAEICCFILNLKISSLNCFLGRRRRMFETKTMLSQRIPLFLSVVLPYYLILFYCSGLYNEFAAKSQCFVTVYIPQGVMATEG